MSTWITTFFWLHKIITSFDVTILANPQARQSSFKQTTHYQMQFMDRAEAEVFSHDWPYQQPS